MSAHQNVYDTYLYCGVSATLSKKYKYKAWACHIFQIIADSESHRAHRQECIQVPFMKQYPIN